MILYLVLPKGTMVLPIKRCRQPLMLPAAVANEEADMHHLTLQPFFKHGFHNNIIITCGCVELALSFHACTVPEGKTQKASPVACWEALSHRVW
jgi:hypothetical protein